MNTAEKRIAKNAGYLLISQVATWGLSLLLTTAMSRALGAQSMGKFYLANSLWGIVTIFATFGMDLMVIKEIARSPEKTPQLLGNSLYLRISLYALGAIFVTIYANVVGYPLETLLVIYVIGVATLLMQFVLIAETALKGLERMEFVSIGGIANKFSVTMLTILILFLGYGVVVAAMVAVIAGVVNLVIVMFSLRRLVKIDLRFHLPTAKEIMVKSIPYLGANLVMVFYSQVGIIILSLLVTEQKVGWYGQASQLFGTFLFIPLVFNTAIYPALSRAFADTPDSLNQMMRKSFDLMMLLSVPVGLGVLVVSDPLVVFLFGRDFHGSGPVLALLGIVSIITTLNMLLGRFFMAIDRQVQYTFIMAAALAATIPLNILLVPWCDRVFGNGAIAGGIAYIATEGGILAITLWRMPRTTLNRSNLWTTARILAAGMVMVAFTWWLRGVFLGIPILVGFAVYTAMIVLLRVVPPDDWALLKSAGQSLANRLSHRAVQPANLPGDQT
jgi:O-antigen/teichoic acid export membrane protein